MCIILNLAKICRICYYIKLGGQMNKRWMEGHFMKTMTQEMLVKRKKRIALECIYKVILFCFEIMTFAVIWTHFFTPLDISKLDEVIKVCFMALVYGGVYHVIARFYKAYRLGTYRTTELMYYHFIVIGITNVLFLLEGSIYKHKILNIAPIIFMCLFQWSVTALITLKFNRMMGRICERREVVIVYGDETYKELQEKNAESSEKVSHM